MRTIWKFELAVTDVQEVMIPAGATLLCVQVQHGKPCLWAMCDVNEVPVKRKIFTHGTGHRVSHLAGPYIGTYQIEGGALVFHVFDQS